MSTVTAIVTTALLSNEVIAQTYKTVFESQPGCVRNAPACPAIVINFAHELVKLAQQKFNDSPRTYQLRVDTSAMIDEALSQLYHHQGANSEVGQPIRTALGMGRFEAMTEYQIMRAKNHEKMVASRAGKALLAISDVPNTTEGATPCQ